jgi:hypothetical protein
VAILGVALLTPKVADAAASMVHLVGLSGTTAEVTKAHQLTVAEASPANYRQYRINNEQNSLLCVAVTTLPASQALVIKQLRVDWIGISTPGIALTYYAGANCAGPVIDTIAGEGFATSVGGMQTSFNEVIPLDPGFGVPAGTTISARFSGGAEAGDFYIGGYAVPVSDVPTATGPD